jgi:hypothetical protein
MANPFNPGAGRKPRYLAGRAEAIGKISADMQQVYDSAAGTRPVIVSGLRGMGKTVLAQTLAEQARRQDWVVIWAEASKGDSLAKKLAQSIYVELRRLRSARSKTAGFFSHALSVLKSFQMKIDPLGSVSFGIDIEPADGYADSGDLSLDLGDVLSALGNAAREAGTAVFICIDELQEAPIEDLAALNVALHSIGQGFEPVPIFFLGVGLPTLPAVLADASSYAERLYRFHTLDYLTPEAASSAFIQPAKDCDITWDEQALKIALDMAGGYPYFIQQCGYSICEQMSEGSTIEVAEATAGVAIAKEELDAGIYKSRWDRTSAKGKEFLRAMAELTQPSKLSDVAKRLGKDSVSEVSVIRERLIEDGLIYAPERGCIAFTIPGMDDFIQSQID